MTIKTRNIADAAITAAKIAANTITAAKLSATMATGFIDLPITSWRVSNAANTNYGLVAATAVIGSGGVGGADAEPTLLRVNAGTDTTARLTWVDAALDNIINDFTLPPDMDVASGLTFKFLTGNSATDANATTWTLIFRAVSTGAYAAGANQGGTGSVAGATADQLRVVSIAIVAAAINVPGAHVSVDLAPDSASNDSVYLYGAWVEYVRV